MAEQPYQQNLDTPTNQASADRPAVSWPKVLGIVMVIAGTLGMLCNGGAAYGSYDYRGLRALQDMAAKTGGQKTFTAEQMAFLDTPLMQNWSLVQTIYMLVGAVLAIVLLACGIGLMMRRAWAVRLSKAWAGIKVVLETAFAAGGWIMHYRVTQAIESGVLQAEDVPLGLLKSSLPMLIAFLVLPLFVLIWLSLANVKEETKHWA